MRVDAIRKSLRRSTIVVVGGANTDILGVSDAPLISRDSNPGHVRVGPGGVGRNIAENLARLGANVHLITAFGADEAAATLAREAEEAGIDISASLRAHDLPGSRYVAISDRDGEMALALNDMRALERITPEFLASEPCRDLIGSAALVVLDANLATPSIAAIGRAASTPVLADAVSAAKVVRLRPVFSGLAALKANALEASTLLGSEVTSLGEAREAATELVEQGVGRVFLTLGTLGSVHASADGVGSLHPPHAEAANTTGAGDAFTAGVAAAHVAALPDAEAAALATALARSTMAVETSVDREIDLARAVESAEELLA